MPFLTANPRDTAPSDSGRARPEPGRVPDLTALWNETRGDPRIRVAILDAPIDRANPCLEAARIEQHWFGDLRHCTRHGTEIASVILASHSSSVRGVAPACSAVSIPIFDCESGRPPSTHQRRLADALYEALAAGAHVINISAGELSSPAAAEPELAEAVRACAAAGVLIVSAVGNEGCDCHHLPSALPCVLAVGATGRNGEPLTHSNWGAIYGAQGILAPGEEIPVAGPDGRSELRTGTSYATALVSGLAALLLSRELKRGRPVRPLLVRRALLAAARQSASLHAGNRGRSLAGPLNLSQSVILLDHWSHTVSDATNLDPALSCPVDAATECPAPALPIRPSGQDDASITQPATTEPTRVTEPSCERAPEAILPSGCGCGGPAARQLVYALGQLAYDFGNEATLDAFKQRVGYWREGANPSEPATLVEFLNAVKDSEPWHATVLTWTLNQGGLPIYAIRPDGPYAHLGYDRLLQDLSEQLPKPGTKPVDRIAVPGVISGTATLFNGRPVPVVIPDLRGLRSWNIGALIGAARETVQGTPKLPAKQSELLDQSAEEFLHRIYFELRNAGRTPQERALNYAGTNLVGPMDILSKMLRANHALDTIHVVRSTICRPGSDCWDVTLAFFNPDQPMQTVRWYHRFTVDVSEVIPVTVDEPRSWKAR